MQFISKLYLFETFCFSYIGQYSLYFFKFYLSGKNKSKIIKRNNSLYSNCLTMLVFSFFRNYFIAIFTSTAFDLYIGISNPIIYYSIAFVISLLIEFFELDLSLLNSIDKILGKIFKFINKKIIEPFNIIHDLKYQHSVFNYSIYSSKKELLILLCGFVIIDLFNSVVLVEVGTNWFIFTFLLFVLLDFGSIILISINKRYKSNLLFFISANFSAGSRVFILFGFVWTLPLFYNNPIWLWFHIIFYLSIIFLPYVLKYNKDKVLQNYFSLKTIFLFLTPLLYY